MLAEIAAANAAFSVIKQCISNGRDVESMMSDIAQFVGAKRRLATQSLSGNLAAVTYGSLGARNDKTRRGLEAGDDHLGPSAWEDLLRTEAAVPKQRHEQLYRKQEKSRQAPQENRRIAR